MDGIRILAFGGCMLRGPLGRARNPNFTKSAISWDGVAQDVIIAGPSFFTYTFGEMIQALSVYLGDRYIPTDIRPLCGMRHDFAPNTDRVLRNVDAILIEPNTSNEIEFEGYYLNRAPLLRVLTPFRGPGMPGPVRKLATRWYNQGIVAMDHDTRRSTAAQLIRALPKDVPNRDLTIAILRNARGSRRDVREGMQQLLHMVDRPVGVVSYTWQYMPDGRAISWPADFRKKVTESAVEFGLPLCEPRLLVEKTGVKAALKADLRHYKEEFMPTVAETLTDFAHRMAGRVDATSDGKILKIA